MTATELWNRLDALASSKDTSNALLETADLLRAHGDLPLLIACLRSGERIHHLYTVFDERNPEATGNRYLICFTSEKQAKKKPVLPPVIADTHEDGPIFSEEKMPRRARNAVRNARAHGTRRRLGRLPRFL